MGGYATLEKHLKIKETTGYLDSIAMVNINVNIQNSRMIPEINTSALLKMEKMIWQRWHQQEQIIKITQHKIAVIWVL